MADQMVHTLWTMLGSMDQRLIVGIFVALMAVLLFWSPILVFVSSLVFIGVLYFKYHYSKSRHINGDHVRQRAQQRPKTSQLMTIDNRFGVQPNVRHIKAARRHLTPFQTDNYVSNYLTNPLNTNSNYFLQSDGLLSSLSNHSMSSSSRGPTPAADMYRSPVIESPISQLGNIPYVKLTPSGSEPITHELKLKSQTVNKPVTVRIAPMPHNMSKYTLNRISSMSSAQDSTLGSSALTNRTANSKSIAEALKRKRGQKPESETEDSIRVSTTKKAKRDSMNAPKVPNGLAVNSLNKKPLKRQTVDATALLHKRFKNNEIFSSYSSLKTPQYMTQTSNTKRKLTPDLADTSEVKTKKTIVLEDESLHDLDPKIMVNTNETSNDLTYSLTEMNVEVEEPIIAKKSTPISVSVHSMADYERDRNKARNRLNRYFNAVKEVTSPKSDTNLVQTITKEKSVSNSSEIGLPSIPAAAIFTTSRIETNVTTTLLNTPISSVLTTSPSSGSSSLQKIIADNSDNCSMTSAPNSPQISVSAVTTFTIAPPVNTSVTASVVPITTATNTAPDISFKFNPKPIDTNVSASALNSSAISAPSPFVATNNLFNGLINNTSTPTALSAAHSSSSNTSSTLTVPQFSSTPISIPNFTQMGGNSLAMPFAATGAAPPPTFTNPQPPNPMFASEPSAQSSLFSVGSGASSRRTAQASRLRSRRR